jgi:hypothetical protein
MAKKARKTLARLSDAFEMLAGADVPVTRLGATPYGCLGLEQWIAKLEHVCAIDCTAGLARAVFAPEKDRPAFFPTPQATCNTLLRHPEVRYFIKERGPGFLWPADGDDETWALATELGQQVIIPKHGLTSRLADDGDARDLLGKAASAFVPQLKVSVEPDTDIFAIGEKAKLGRSLVAQWHDRDGRHTAFVSRPQDWADIAPGLAGRRTALNRFILHRSFLVEGVITPEGSVFGPPLLLQDAPGLSGAVAAPEEADGVRVAVLGAMRKVAAALQDLGYRGFFGCKTYVEADTGKAFVKDVLTGHSPVSQLTHFLTGRFGGMPLSALHVLSYMDCAWDLDLGALQKRWMDHDTWSLLVISHDGVGTDFITKAPASGIYMIANGALELAAPSLDPMDLRANNEFLLLRTLGSGTYRESGMVLGLALARGDVFGDGRAQTIAQAVRETFNTVSMSGTSLPASNAAGGRLGLF